MRRSLGLNLLSAFFTFGSLMAFLSFLGLLLPGGPFEAMWRFNPRAHDALNDFGMGGVVLMLVVASACALAAIGLWIRARWGLWLAVLILSVNLVGDLLSAVLRNDLRTLIGLPVGGALILYLLSPPTRAQFEVHSTAV